MGTLPEDIWKEKVKQLISSLFAYHKNLC